MTHKMLDRNGEELHEGDLVKIVWRNQDSVTSFKITKITDIVTVKPITGGIGYASTVTSTDLRKLRIEELI